MKKNFLLLAMIAVIGSSSVFAQKKDSNPKVWEEAQARKVVPEIRTFVSLADLQDAADKNTRNTRSILFGN